MADATDKQEEPKPQDAGDDDDETAPPPTAAADAPLPEGLPSKGSVHHGQGECKPCAWFYKPQGCRNGKDCGHCHLCPEGELKARKKKKLATLKSDKSDKPPERETTVVKRDSRYDGDRDRRPPGGGYAPPGYPPPGYPPPGHDPYAADRARYEAWYRHHYGGGGYPPAPHSGMPFDPAYDAYYRQHYSHYPPPPSHHSPPYGYPPPSGGYPPPGHGYPPPSGYAPPPSYPHYPPEGYPPVPSSSYGHPPPAGYGTAPPGYYDRYRSPPRGYSPDRRMIDDGSRLKRPRSYSPSVAGKRSRRDRCDSD